MKKLIPSTSVEGVRRAAQNCRLASASLVAATERTAGMDAFTRRHFEAWMNSQFPSDQVDAIVRPLMLEAFARDPELWMREGWARLAEHVDAWAEAAVFTNFVASVR